VLSSANQSRVESARDAARSIADGLEEVLTSAASEESESEEKHAVLRLAQPPAAGLSAGDVRAIVAETVQTVVRQALGRLD
jgi:hypothetical protein